MSGKIGAKSTLAAVLGATLIATTALPSTAAYAGPRHGHGWHGGHAHPHHHHHRKRSRNNNGDLIAAGIIGLAIGAIIASEASKNRPQPSYTYSQPYSQPYSDPYPQANHYRQPQTLQEYESNVSDYGSGGPNVITFNDPADLEPWSPGWYEWCDNRYRSFNPSRGTYRGYDGLDHFCVPK